MLKKINKKVFIDLLFIFILSLTPLLWFREGMVMVGHDNVFPLNPSEFLKSRLYTWGDQGFGQDQTLFMGTIPIHFIDALPSLLGFSLQSTQKLVYVFWFLLIGISVYILASVINKESRIFKLTAVVLYQFNFFVLQGWWIGERTKFSALIALPLVLSVFILVYQGKIKLLKASIVNSLILFLFNGGGVIGLSLFGGFFLSLFVFLLFFSSVSFLERNYLSIKNLLLTILFSILGFFLVNAYYIFPALLKFLSAYKREVSSSGGLSGFIDWAEQISVGASFLNLFRLQGIAEWYDNSQHPFAKYFLDNPYLIFISFLWPVLIFLSVLLIKKREKLKFILYFFLLYLAGIFFVAGTHPPLGFIYGLLVKIVPGFAIFRSPYFKFAPALFLANSFLIAFFIDHFRGFFKKFLFILILLLWLGYHFPYFTGDFFQWQKELSTRVKIPSYVFDFAKFINSEKKDEGRVLLIPPNSPAWQFDTYNWGYLSLFPLPRLLTQQSILVNDSSLTESQSYLLEVIYKSILEGDEDTFQKLASHLSIKYLLLRNDFFYNLSWVLSESPFIYKQAINNTGAIYKIKEFGEWELYAISNPKPNFYSTVDINAINLPKKDIESYYDFESAEFFLNDSEVFDVKSQLSFLASKTYIKPECLSCKHEKKPDFVLPESTVLPDSPFYFLLQLKEKRDLKTLSPKALIYHYLGLSLKRISEIRELIIKRGPGEELKKEYFLFYNDTLTKMSNLFNEVGSFSDKYEIAYTLKFFLEEEENLLRIFLGEHLTNEEELKIIDESLVLISSLKGKVNPYLFKEDSKNNKLYYVNLDKSNNYEIFLKTEDVKTIATSKEDLKIIIDDKLERDIKLDSPIVRDDWISFGRVELAEGAHTFLLVLQEKSSLVSDFQLEEEDIKLRTQLDKCYSSYLARFDNQKTYKVELKYLNDFSDNFSMFFKSKKGDEWFTRVIKLKKGEEKVIEEEIVYPDKEMDDLKIGFCAPNLSLDALKEKTELEVYEIIHPFILLNTEQKLGTIDEKPLVDFKRVNPSKYSLEVKNAKQPFILSFLQSFNSGWKASVVSQSGSKEVLTTHFSVNGYANGWLIDKTGDYSISVEYAPQKMFYLGILLTAVTVLGSVGYLILKR